ncbi:WxL protein peptidoglycan domain-containing protein [Actinoplanes sp. NPDC020271]|uniref:WxL protein peptidoglycan domain-containing protein n=1 Tax=Actinoplanes sp. NPDC020271 TaxID=3363896 RepID=UPI0037BC627B
MRLSLAGRASALRKAASAVIGLSFVTASAVVGLSVTPALAEGDDVTWAVRTASNTYGNDRSSYSYAVNPGGSAQDGLVVANKGDTPLTLAVYAADGLTTSTGQLDLLARDKKSQGIGIWVAADTPTVTVPAGKIVEVPFKVAVPANATPGDYVGGIVTSLTAPDTTAQVNVERRLGIKIKLRVGGALVPSLAVEDLKVDWSGAAFARGAATVNYTIHNTGNAVESAKQAVSITGPFGLLRTESDPIAAPPELLPGESRKVSVPVHGVAPAVLLTATVKLTPLVTDESGSTTALDAVTANAHVWALPWTLTVLLIVLIVAVIALIWLRRRSRVRRKAREEARIAEAVEQALKAKSAKAPASDLSSGDAGSSGSSTDADAGSEQVAASATSGGTPPDES